MTPDKEIIQELLKDKVDSGYRCPRCNRYYRYNFVHIRYCIRCGQRLAPFMLPAKEQQIKEEMLASVKIEDLEK